VPLGARDCLGVVWAENSAPNPRLHNRLKDVDDKLEYPPLKGELRQFLFDRFYKSHRVLRGTVKGQMIIKRLFEHFTARFDPHTQGWQLLPDDVRENYHEASLKGQDALRREPSRIVADFIAGMTDREAYSLYVKLFEVGTA